MWKLAGEVSGLSMEELIFKENEQLDITEYTQIAILTVEVAILKVLEAKGLKADLCAGLSLGEYGALAAGGVMELSDLFRVIRKRGIYMQEAYPQGGAMTAVLGIEPEKIKEICVQTEGIVSIANDNCPGQIVISGEAAAVEAAAERAKRAGAKRCIPLKVSGPFHSALLAGAGEKLRTDLDTVKIHNPAIPYLSNVTAEPVMDGGEIRELLVKQISHPVRFRESIERMLADGADTFIEIGPGKTLGGFVRKINRDVTVCHIERPADMEQVMEELAC